MLITRKYWEMKLKHDYAGYVNGSPHILTMDHATGATVLEPVTILEEEYPTYCGACAAAAHAEYVTGLTMYSRCDRCVRTTDVAIVKVA
jgi:hypothetical protein